MYLDVNGAVFDANKLFLDCQMKRDLVIFIRFVQHLRIDYLMNTKKNRRN